MNSEFSYFQPAKYNRLEKADILEMTVNHLKSLQRQQVKGEVIILYVFYT